MGTRLYIGNLSRGVRERDLERFFDGYGRISDVVLKEGFGFVQFNDRADADDAIHDLDGRDLMGRRVRVEHTRRAYQPSRPPPFRGGRGDRSEGSRPIWLDKYGAPEKTRYQIKVENLSTRVSWQDLKDMCRPHGEVTYADAHRETRNEGVICASSSRDMKKIIEALDGKEVNGKKMKLIDARRSKTRSRSRSRSRSGSRKRSVSRSRSPRSRSKSRSGSKGRSVSKERSASKERSVSKERSASKGRSASRSRSRSASRGSSPRQNGHGD